VLRMANVIDDDGDWSGDVDYFVQTGDIVDRYVSPVPCITALRADPASAVVTTPSKYTTG
jgi:hypothetical protein